MIIKDMETNNGAARLTYEEFAALYRRTFNRAMGYTINQVGLMTYIERLAELADEYPEWADRVEAEPEP